jgi:hypothetical protein
MRFSRRVTTAPKGRHRQLDAVQHLTKEIAPNDIELALTAAADVAFQRAARKLPSSG